ncbi:hypothetical protein RHGRI_034203 [Rhododendron griersonianum]|uniref:Lipoxygenase domain-containing protein n=1 Tax=Rhododendron griersonianum TaxID=479676 RepID=A0AAV6I2V7_9ERIC|nr:hypothetical protein RHGRI_034203 [Rhododendron griersonianum]
MADPHHLLTQPSNPQIQIQIQNQAQTPLLNTTDQTQENPEESSDCDPHLDKNLQKLELFLALLGFDQSSALRFGASWIAFLLIGVALPLAALELFNCSDCEKYQIKIFEVEIVASQSCLAAVSLLCLSHNLRKYGIRTFLFVDRCSGQMNRFGDQYTQKISVSSLVQVAGITLCLNAAAKISHRAQGIASLASKWHATVTCSSADASQIRVSSSMGNLGVASTLGSVFINNPESDLEALEHITMPRNTHLGSYLSSYCKRQAFVLYLQMNPGGITIFGLTVDRDPFSESRIEKPHPVYVPRDETFEEIKQNTFSAGRLKAVLHNLIPSIAASLSSTDISFKCFFDIDKLYNDGVVLKDEDQNITDKQFLSNLMRRVATVGQRLFMYEVPAIIKRDRFVWLRDNEFARQMLAGVNPVGIELLRFPLLSKLDPAVYGPPESAITKDLIEQELLQHGMGVDEAIEKKRVFLLDCYDMLLPLIEKMSSLPEIKAYASRTIFFYTRTGFLRTIAIELSIPPTSSSPGNKRVYAHGHDNTTHWIWKLAKAHVCSNDAGVHQLVNHWLRTHAGLAFSGVLDDDVCYWICFLVAVAAVDSATAGSLAVHAVTEVVLDVTGSIYYWICFLF